jgi:hypothetical protein
MALLSSMEAEIIGLITYIIKDNECEIISLDSIEEGKGIGTSLVLKWKNGLLSVVVSWSNSSQQMIIC